MASDPDFGSVSKYPIASLPSSSAAGYPSTAAAALGYDSFLVTCRSLDGTERGRLIIFYPSCFSKRVVPVAEHIGGFNFALRTPKFMLSELSHYGGG